jgi:dTMP kinase
MPMLTKGLLIAIEGIDGSGKSTLARNLFTLLHDKQYKALLTKEPGDTQLGKKIRELVQTQTIPLSPVAEYLLFAADRAQHFTEMIIPALTDKKIILSDRLSDSSLAYQGYGRDLELSQLQSINSWAMNNIVPDLTIFVRVPVANALERVTNRGTLSAFEKIAFLDKVANGFEMLYKNRPDVMIVDGTQSQDSLTLHTYKVLETWLQNNNLLF